MAARTLEAAGHSGAGVAFAPGVDFGVHRAQQHVRTAYALDERKLDEGVARLRDFLSRP